MASAMNSLPPGFVIESPPDNARPARPKAPALPPGFVVEQQPQTFQSLPAAPLRQQQKEDVAAPGISDYASEFGNATVRGAAGTTAGILRGANVLTTDSPDEIRRTEEGITRLKTMTAEQATDFMRSLPTRLSPAVAFNYQVAIRKLWDGKTDEAQSYLDRARGYTDTRPIDEQGLSKAAAAIEGAANKSFPQDPRFRGSITSDLGQGLGSTAAFLPIGLLTGGTGVALTGAAAGANEGYQEAARDLASQRRDDRGEAYNSGLGTEAQVKALQAGRLSALPGASEVVPVETFIEQAPRFIPGLRPIAGSPAFKRFARAFGRVGTQVLAEGGQEAFQTWAGNVINQITVDPSQALDENVLYNFAIGGAVGGGMQTVMEGYGAATGGERSGPQAPPPAAPPPGQGRTEPRLFPDQPPGPQAGPAAPPPPQQQAAPQPDQPAPARPGPPPGFVVEDAPQSGMDPEDDAYLRGAGYTPEQIADMNAPERAAAAQEARQQGVEPVSLAVTPPPPGTAPMAPRGTRQARQPVQTPDDLEAVRPVVNTEPSAAQAQAGNYQKAHVRIAGMDVTIENPRGSIRRSKDDADPWQSPALPADYGYIKRTTGKDGDQVDVYIGPNPQSERVFVIDQMNLKTGKFDEHKAVLGARELGEAVDLYVNSFDNPTLDRIGDVTEMSVDEFRQWVRDGQNTKRPAAKAGVGTVTPNVPDVSSQPVEAIGQPQPIPQADPPAAAPDQPEGPRYNPTTINPQVLDDLKRYLSGTGPVTPEAFARFAKIDAAEAGKALQYAGLRGGLIVGKNGNWRRPRTFKGPANVLDFIASIGGIRDVTGELRGMDLPKMTQFGPVVRKNGLHPDKVREQLIEEGYLFDPGRGTGRQAQTTVADVYDLISQHMSGMQVFAAEDQAEADAIRVQKLNENMPDDWQPQNPIEGRFGPAVWADIQEFLADSGTTEESWSQSELRDAARLIAGGMEASNAFERVVVQNHNLLLDTEGLDPALEAAFQNGNPNVMVAFEDVPFPDLETPPDAVEQQGPQEAGNGAGPAGPDRLDGAGQAADAGPAAEVRSPGARGGQEGGRGQDAGPVASSEEPGAEGRPQLVIPGAEQDVRGAMQNAAKAPLKASAPQKGMDVGLFGSERDQTDMFDQPQARAEAAPTPQPAAAAQPKTAGQAEKPANWKDQGKAAGLRGDARSAPADVRSNSARAVSDWYDGWDAGNAAAPVPNLAPAEQQALPSYGSANTLVSKDRAAELREKLKAKLKNQVFSGIDPEMLAMGAELAAFHIEAGARRFSDFARAIAADLGASIQQVRPYLRAWYNGARDMMEDAGIDVAGMDSPDEVRSALKALDEERDNGQGDRLRQEAPGVPAATEPQSVQQPQSERPTGESLQDGGVAGGGNVRDAQRADADGNESAARIRSKGDGARSNSGSRGRNRDARVGAGSATESADVAQEVRRLEKERADRRALNYRIAPEDRIGQGSPKEKVAANIEAIRTLKTIVDEKRGATPEEKRTLVRYVGWGAFAQDVFAKHKPEWAKERAALADLLTAEEYASARASTLNAHYTSEDVITGMWKAVEHLGFQGGRALEPSSGVGHFIGLVPDRLAAKTDWSAVELDTLTGGIAKLLYEGADVNVMGFETFNRPPNFYDIAISNVPFGNFPIRDPKRPGYLIHDYFFVKGLDMVRPGGIVAFITSSGTMDKNAQETRKAIAKRADLVGAIRLPGGRKGAFAGNAGTEVTTDIIFLRKRDAATPALLDAPRWMDVKTIQTPDGPAQINEYFADRPEMMLGEMRLTGTMYAAKSPVLVGETDAISEKIAAAAANMPANIMLARSSAPTVKDTKIVEATQDGKEGGYFEQKGKLYRKVQGVGQPQNLAATDTEKIKALVGIRDIVNELLANQAKGRVETNDALRERLNKAYDAFVKKHGPINLENTTTTNRLTRSGDFVVITKRPNFSKFSLDPDAFKVAAIENYNPDTKTAAKAAIFTTDILGPAPAPQIASSADTIGWSLNAFGRLNIPEMAVLAGKTEAQIIADLGGLIYEDPVSAAYQPRDQYLSGDVVTKLEEAQGAAEADPRYKRNVEALEKVQPAPLTREDIRVPFGAPWVPPDVYTAFFRDEMDSDIVLSLNPVTKRWGIKSGRYSRTAETKYATSRYRIDEAIKSALDQTPVRIMDKDGDKVVFNAQASEEAQVRVNALRDAFAGSADGAVTGWIWNDDERSARLEAVYNKSFNRLVPQKFDGAHLSLPGLAATITDSAGQKVPFALRAHQKNAIARIIQNGNTLLAHVVGAGKTFTMIAAGMEQRRLGQKQRPMFIVPNHMLEQFSREFLQAYPGANILVAQKDEMTRENRKAFAAKIAAQKWDGIIITHDAFGRIRMSPEAYEEFVRGEIEAAERAKIAAADEEGKKTPTVKDLEKLIKKLETKLANLIKEERKDEGVTFEELGVDQLYLDEAHLFKNLSFYTRHTRIKGIGGTASQRATDLFMKIRHLEKAYPGRSTVFATGTPVSNTMAEMYTMQRYLQLETLREYGVDEFDAWASTFGEVRSQMELGPDGRTLRETTSFSRFINIPELYAMYSRVADAQTADMLNLPRPKRMGGKAQIIEAEFSPLEEAIAQEIVQRAVQLKGKKAEKGADNMLKVVSDGRKLATDARLLNPDASYNPKGKTAKLIENVHRIWKDNEFPALAQLIFLDMGVPQNAKTATKPTEAVEDDDAALDVDTEAEEALASRFDLYADIRDRLVSRGIPREQIAFIHDANDDIKKARLFGKVRNGEVRVLIGSTAKMGVGTNVQRLLIALHHDDAPWKPAEVEQRDGRGERQGNLNPEIAIYRYITKKSMDAFMWQTLERKSQFIGQLLSGARGVRHAEDIDSPLPEAADLKAAATGDPRIMEQAELTKRERELKVAKSSHDRVITEAKRGIAATEAKIAHFERESAAMSKDAAKVKPTAGDAFKMTLTVRGRSTEMTSRKEAGERIRLFAVEQGRTTWGPPKPYDIGSISGIDVQIALKRSDDGVEYAFGLQGEASYGQAHFSILTEDADPIGIVRRIENILADVPRMANFTAEELDRSRKTLGNLRAAAVDKPFARQKELDEVSARLQALNDQFKKENETKKQDGPSSQPNQAPLSSRAPQTPELPTDETATSGFRQDLISFAMRKNMTAGTAGDNLYDLRLAGFAATHGGGTALLGQKAAAYVVSRGRAVQAEVLVAFDGKGRLVSDGVGREKVVGFSPEMADLIVDPNASVVVHHNHPSSWSLSSADLAYLAFPGLKVVWAHGNNGQYSYRASIPPDVRRAISPDRLSKLVFDAFTKVNSNLYNPIATVIRNGGLSVEDANLLIVHLTNQALHNAGLVDYFSTYTPSVPQAIYGAYSDVNFALRFYLQATLGGPISEILAKAADVDRSARTVRSIGDMGLPSPYAEKPARQRTVEGRNDSAGQTGNSPEEVGSADQQLTFDGLGRARLSSSPVLNRFRFVISDRQSRELTAEINQIAQRILGRRLAAVNVTERLPGDEDAYFDPNTGVIYIALQSILDPNFNIRHEAIHALRQAGVFSPQEWAVLSRMARSRWIDQYGIRKRYDQMYRERFDITPDQLEELMIEEAVADAYGHHSKQPPAGDVVSRIFFRVRQFLRALANMLAGRGFTTPESILSRVEAGEMAGRRAGSGQGRGFLVPARQESAAPRQASLASVPPDDGVAAAMFAQAAGTEDVGLAEFAGNINLSKIDAAEDIKEVLRDAAEKAQGFIKARRGVVSHDQTKDLAEKSGMSVQQLLKRKAGQAFNAHEAYAARAMLIKSAEIVKKAAARAKNTTSDVDRAYFMRVLTRHAAIQEQVAGMTAEAGRALNQFKMLVGADYLRGVSEMLSEKTSRGNMGPEAVRDIAEMIDSLQTPGQVGRMTRDMFKPRFVDMVREYYINSLLSGPTTQTVNFMSNMLVALNQIPEAFVAEQIGRFRGDVPDKVRRGESAARAIGLLEGARDGMRLAWMALKTGEQQTPESQFDQPAQKAIPGLAGEIIRVPSRLMMSADEFFKAVNYRAELAAIAVRAAQGEGLQGEALAQRVLDLRDNPTPAMVQRAAAAGKYQTFQTKLGPMGQSLMRFREAWQLWWLLPFLRTPINILKYAAERSPVGPLLMREVRDNLQGKNGNAAQDTQIARIALGTVMLTGMAALAISGAATGGGSDDEREKAVLRASGWQPYSINWGGKYYSYLRFDPFSLHLGIVADMIELRGKIAKGDYENLGWMLAASVINNVTDKTWLKSATEFSRMTLDPKAYMENYLSHLTSGFVPNLLAQIARFQDPVFRDARSMLDKIKERVPGLRETLPPRYDVFGEQIAGEGNVGPDLFSPVYVSTKKDNPVADALIGANYYPGKPRRHINGHDLTPEQYAEYTQIAGQEAVRRLIGAVGAKSWSGRSQDNREQFLKRGFDKAREIARKQLMRRYPELRRNADAAVASAP